MSDAVRAVAILVSVVLWSPVARPLLAGETSPDEALVLYAAALLLSLTGCAAMAALVRAYSPAPAEPEEPESPSPADGPASTVDLTDALGRRAEDQQPA